MKKNLTEIVFILDKSGSMSNLTNDTIGGFNSMIEQQKNEDGEAYVTTVLFSENHFMLHDHVNIKDIKPMTHADYMAYGMTALLDAVGTTINSIGERLANTPEEERPEKVIFVITTDGFENSSKEFTREKIKESSQKAYDKAQSTVKEIQEKAENISNEMAKKGEELINKIQGMIDKQKGQEG